MVRSGLGVLKISNMGISKEYTIKPANKNGINSQ